jgi:hypothetical protein
LWETVIESNETLYKDEIHGLLDEGLLLQKMTYFSNKDQGIYVFTDNKGFFTLLRRHSTFNADGKGPTTHEITFFKRVYSGFPSIILSKSQIYLTVFTSGDKIGFMRAFDGQIGSSPCSLNTTEITSFDFDQNRAGVLYVTTKDGIIHIIFARTRKKNDVYCEEIGQITGNSESNSQIIALKKMLLTYNDQSGSFQVFNITEAVFDKSANMDYSVIVPVTYTPDYLKIGNNSNTKLDIIQGQTENGHQLILRVPGNNDKLILVDVLNTLIEHEPWYWVYLSNKGLIMTVCVMVIIGYQIVKSRSSSEEGESREYNSIKGLINKNQNIQDNKLDEISKKLAMFQKSNTNMDEFNNKAMGALSGDLKSLLKSGNTPKNANRNVRFAEEQ